MTSTSTWYPPTLGTGGFLIDPTNPPFTMNEPTTQDPALSPDLFADLLEHATRAQNPKGVLAELARLAYAAGADAELDACCKWLEDNPIDFFSDGRPVRIDPEWLRDGRRPKPPSLKELALNDLTRIMANQQGMFDGKPFDTIRRALELIPDA